LNSIGTHFVFVKASKTHPPKSTSSPLAKTHI
jgi:hypothetical protein